MSEITETKEAQNPSHETKVFENAVKDKDRAKGLKEAFELISEEKKGVRALVKASHIQCAITCRGGKEPPIADIDKILKLSNKGYFNYDEFVDIIRLFEEPGEANQKGKIYDKLIPKKEPGEAKQKGKIHDEQIPKKEAGEAKQKGKIHDARIPEKEPGEAKQKGKIHDEQIPEKEPGEAKQEDKTEVKRLTLHGKDGVGKTWLAREVANRAVRKGEFDFAIWIYLNRNYDDVISLRESIAYQLYVLAKYEESQAEKAKKEKEMGEEMKMMKKKKEEKDKSKEKEGKEKSKEKEGKEKMETEEYYEGTELEKIIWEASRGKKILFVLDSQGSRMQASVESKKNMGFVEKGEKISIDVELLRLEGGGKKVEVVFKRLKSYKMLFTRTEAGNEPGEKIEVKPFTWEYSEDLASKAMEREEVPGERKEEAKELAHYFMFRSNRLPSELCLITRIVANLAKEKEKEKKDDEKKEGSSPEKTTDAKDGVGKKKKKTRDAKATVRKKEESGMQKLREARDAIRKGGRLLDVLIKINTIIPKSVLIDCYSTEASEDHFLRRGCKVSFNALIFYWIMEDHLGKFNRIEDAYVEGHRIVLELLECGLLEKQEGDTVVATRAVNFHLDIWDYEGFFRDIRPGLAVTFDFRLGYVALADGMIRSTGRQSLEIIPTVFLDGNRISEEKGIVNPSSEHKDRVDVERKDRLDVVESLSKRKDRVEVVAIKEPTCKHFDLPFGDMQSLRLLALRGCQFLLNLDKFVGAQDQTRVDLAKLFVLEISSATLVKDIPDKLFDKMPNLKTLNLSKLVKVEILPQSFYSLTKLEFLILRECKSLKELKSIKNFKDLKILDVSDATSFEKFEDKSLHDNGKLQVLNVSNTKLKTLPLINKLNKLKFVFLRGCEHLPRIRKIDSMKSLQIFDINGAKQVERFCDPSLEELKDLVIVDISGTGIRRLPANIGDPTYLYANNCRRLKSVPPIEGLTKLQVLHFSGCNRLTEIRTEFFSSIKGLIELDLSKTKVTELPFLSSLHTLRRLLLSECESLKKLEGLDRLEELEVLDLSGCKNVTELKEGSFDTMSRLQRLNLSGTGIGGEEKPLPSLSKLKSLKELLVRDCPNLTKLPGHEELKDLEVLDCSGTLLDSTPDEQENVFGADVKSIDTVDLFKNLGAAPPPPDETWNVNHEAVSKCKWNVSNWRAEDSRTLVCGAHFYLLLEKYPSFLQENLTTFRLLFYPSEAGFDDSFKTSYSDELSLRDIYFKQVYKEKIERSLEIRGFAELPESLQHVISKARAEFVLLVDVRFLRSLVDDLGVRTVEGMKACWIERCNELKHVVAVAEKVTEGEKPGEGDQKHVGGKGEMVKGEGNRRKKKDGKTAAEKEGESAKSEESKQKNTDAEKAGESAKNEGDGEKKAAEGKAGESATNEGHDDKEKNAATDNSETKAKSEGDEKKNAAEEKAGESATNEGHDDKDKKGSTDSSEAKAKSEGDEKKNAAEGKAGESSTNEGHDDKEKNAATDSSETKAKSEGDEKKKAGEEKAGESATNEGDDKEKNAATVTSETKAKSEKTNAADGKAEEPANPTTTTAPENLKEELKNPADDLKSLEILWVSDNPKLESILRGITFQQLNSIYIEYCPNLSEICSSSSQLPGLEKLYIKYCKNLKSLFGKEDSPTLYNLKNLQLWGLHSLERIGCNAPILEKLRVGQCPKLEHLMPSRFPKKEEAGTKNKTEEHAKTAADGIKGFGELKVLHIKLCDKIESIFEDDDDADLKSLIELELWGLPKLTKVARATEQLRFLKVSDCPSLKNVITNVSEHLETVEVKSCEKMTEVFENKEPALMTVKKIELVGLPVLKSLGPEVTGEGTGEGEQYACPKLDDKLIRWFSKKQEDVV